MRKQINDLCVCVFVGWLIELIDWLYRILTSSGWDARSSCCLTWYLTLLSRFWTKIARAKLILYSSGAKRYTKTCFQRIVFSAIIICIEKLLKPLQKFEIILETTFYQFIHGNYLVEKVYRINETFMWNACFRLVCFFYCFCFYAFSSIQKTK